VRELVVISGKGGTGKTSVVASFAALAESPVLADCDVDAPDLHLIMAPEVTKRGDFSGGCKAVIDPSKCTACGKCYDLCRFDAITLGGTSLTEAEVPYTVDRLSCEGCNVCAWFCPEKAIEMVEVVNGEWYISETRFGPMSHAALGAAEENSGKLVTLVRTRAKVLARENGRELIIVDGSPGLGCPVIASVAGADAALIVTEPTLSGVHDAERVGELLRHFGIIAFMCVNKWDINPGIAEAIETAAAESGIESVGRIRYDDAVTRAQIEGLSLVEFAEDGAALDVRNVWEAVRRRLQ
jgi:MinD superfamily P-loop ATPase